MPPWSLQCSDSQHTSRLEYSSLIFGPQICFISPRVNVYDTGDREKFAAKNVA